DIGGAFAGGGGDEDAVVDAALAQIDPLDFQIGAAEQDAVASGDGLGGLPGRFLGTLRGELHIGCAAAGAGGWRRGDRLGRDRSGRGRSGRSGAGGRESRGGRLGEIVRTRHGHGDAAAGNGGARHVDDRNDGARRGGRGRRGGFGLRGDGGSLAGFGVGDQL